MSTGVDEERIPVLAAVGQVTERDGGGVDAIGLAEMASRAALDRAPGLAEAVGKVCFVGSLSPVGPAPAAILGARLGLGRVSVETTTIGGNTPQWLVTRAADAIAAGRGDTVLIAGGEALASGGRGPRAEGEAGGADPVVGDVRPGTSAYEVAIGLYLPAHVYPMLESAQAARLGRDLAEHRRHLGAFLSPFTEVAAAHPLAWFPQARSAEEISRPGPGNRITAEPYTTRMNAMIRVDQGAALVVSSLAAARRAGVADQVVYIWSGADAVDVWAVPARAELTTSPAISAAGGAALSAVGLGIDDVDYFDLYSCFPIAVEIAAAALGIRLDDRRGLTVTGGLPYFGGPGNNYTTHAIATLAGRLLEGGGTGLVSGLGWFVTKHSIGLYGSTPPPGGFRVGDTTAGQAAIEADAIPVVDTASGPARVEAATVIYDREGSVTGAPVYARLPGGSRVVAAAHPEELAALAGINLVGATVDVAATPPTYRVSDPQPAEEAPS
ncbi:MAG: acetyl-CoA acetyltransferase [Acidimicrobiales bacterium]